MLFRSMVCPGSDLAAAALHCGVDLWVGPAFFMRCTHNDYSEVSCVSSVVVFLFALLCLLPYWHAALGRSLRPFPPASPRPPRSRPRRSATPRPAPPRSRGSGPGTGGAGLRGGRAHGQAKMTAPAGQQHLAARQRHQVRDGPHRGASFTQGNCTMPVCSSNSACAKSSLLSM